MRVLIKYGLIFFCLAVMSCKTKQHNILREETTNSISSDSLREPTHYYFLADIDPKIIANLILHDSIKPSDNYSTFRIMDSINSISYSDRQFYIKVFINIMEKADGALAEAVGSPALAFVELHTKEFFELNPALTKDQFNKWANFVGIEVYLSSNNGEKEKVEEFIKIITANCNGCSSKTNRRVEAFCNLVKESIDNIEE